MELIFNPIHTHAEKSISFVIIVANYNNSDEWVFVQKNDNNTWELPAGHKKKGESSLEAAQRELFEETGAKEYTMEVLSDYTLVINNEQGVGRIFLAIISKLGPLPSFEIKKRIIAENMPLPHTYPLLQEQMLVYAKLQTRKD